MPCIRAYLLRRHVKETPFRSVAGPVHVKPDPDPTFFRQAALDPNLAPALDPTKFNLCIYMYLLKFRLNIL